MFDGKIGGKKGLKIGWEQGYTMGGGGAGGVNGEKRLRKLAQGIYPVSWFLSLTTQYLMVEIHTV